MTTKQTFPRELALAVAREISIALAPACAGARIMVAGSIRRLKKEVGDVEIVFVPRVETDPTTDLFSPKEQDLVTPVVCELVAQGVLEKRTSIKGTVAFGAKNKLMRHLVSGVPVDLFATSEDSWYNYLVCRTGGAQNNVDIASAAKAKGWKWNPYGSGFTRPGETPVIVRSEQEVYEFVGMEYREPKFRS